MRQISACRSRRCTAPVEVMVRLQEAAVSDVREGIPDRWRRSWLAKRVALTFSAVSPRRADKRAKSLGAMPLQ